ncbi:MAG TPA: hypothetical protein VHE61_21845 [Opitutaceae bacterium]|nr:hypothetical protein [Opitutaceae bacterium]
MNPTTNPLQESTARRPILDQYGAACRCLLRLRENRGVPGISDSAFIARFVTRYPDWCERPGAMDLMRTGEVARALSLAEGIEVYRDYDKVLQSHRDGRSVLICTDRVPAQEDGPAAPGRFVLLLVAMDEATFTVWCPYPNGHSDTLVPAQRMWWDHWQALGLVLFAAQRDQ